MRSIKIGKAIIAVAIFHFIFCTMIWGETFYGEAELADELRQQFIQKVLWVVGLMTYFSNLYKLYEYNVGRMDAQVRMQERLKNGLAEAIKNGGVSYMGCGNPDCEDCKSMEEDLKKASDEQSRTKASHDH